MNLTRDPSKIDFKTEKVRDIEEWKRDPRPYTDFPARAKVSSAEIHQIYRMAYELGSGNYADVGVFRGNTTAALAHGLEDGKHDGTVYSVDYFNLNPTYSDPGAKDRISFYFKEKNFRAKLKLCEGESSAWGRKLDIPFKFAFIDAGHDYKSVKQDFLAWGRLILPGGIIAFHDCDFYGVRKVISQLGPEWRFIRQIFSMKLFMKTCR